MTKNTKKQIKAESLFVCLFVFKKSSFKNHFKMTNDGNLFAVSGQKIGGNNDCIIECRR